MTITLDPFDPTAKVQTFLPIFHPPLRPRTPSDPSAIERKVKNLLTELTS